MQMDKRREGEFGEKLAAAYLLRHHYRILEQNFRIRWGEIDLIAEKEGEIVFVEVKTRTQSMFGPPEEAVNYFKQKKLLRAAEWYLLQRGWEQKNYRFDTIAVELDLKTRRAHIRHLMHAIRLD